jgi:hypothetical protein
MNRNQRILVALTLAFVLLVASGTYIALTSQGPVPAPSYLPRSGH